MRATVKSYLPAIGCALVPIACYLLIQPYAEIGIDDDWSYIKTAQVLAQTGHIAFNGWASATLGWQLYLGALFVKLFGFSFTAVRFSTAVEAVVTAFLLQRTCLRAGVNSRNATLSTMSFVVSPLYAPRIYVFLTDVSGVLCVVACIYMCLRALQAESTHAAAAWISVAALVNAVGGTARQVAWLGVLVMVPCTLWLLRKNRRVLAAGCVSWIAGAVIVAASMYWFYTQPYSIPAPHPDRFDLDAIKNLGRAVVGGTGIMALCAVPVLFFFALSLRMWKRWTTAIAAVLFLAPMHFFKIDRSPANVAHDFITTRTFERLNALAAGETRLAAARYGLRALLTGITIFGLMCLVLCFVQRRPGRADPPQEGAEPVSWWKLSVMLVPFCAAYFVLVSLQAAILDRYFMPTLAILLLVLARFYQEQVRAELPLASVSLILFLGAFSVIATHDNFAMYRGYVDAINELRLRGISATAILGPWEFRAWTEIENAGHLNDDRIRVPKGAYVPQPARRLPGNCTPGFFGSLDEMPHLRPVYAVSTNPRDCGGEANYPQAMYRTWVAPRVNAVYAVRLPPSFPN